MPSKAIWNFVSLSTKIGYCPFNHWSPKITLRLLSQYVRHSIKRLIIYLDFWIESKQVCRDYCSYSDKHWACRRPCRTYGTWINRIRIDTELLNKWFTRIEDILVLEFPRIWFDNVDCKFGENLPPYRCTIHLVFHRYDLKWIVCMNFVFSINHATNQRSVRCWTMGFVLVLIPNGSQRQCHGSMSDIVHRFRSCNPTGIGVLLLSNEQLMILMLMVLSLPLLELHHLLVELNSCC